MSGTAPEPTNPGGRIDQDRVLTSSGVAPTGGVPVGGEADRVQPDRWARRHGSASGAVDPGENYEGENSDVLVQPAAQAGRNE
jgi:hypothetical protein